MKKTLLIIYILLFSFFFANGQEPNYEESKVPQYVLPDPLKMENGESVDSKTQWVENRRPEILHLFETHIYGKAPERPMDIRCEILSENKYALGNMATRKEIALYFTDSNEHYMTILMYIPNKRAGAVPLFFGLNFKGNHSICEDPDITESVIRMEPRKGESEIRPHAFKLGDASSRWPVEMLIANGYGLATVYSGDIDPDYDDGFQNGVHPLFYKSGQTRPEPNEWGTLATWAWGLSCAMDYFETDEDIDATKVAVFGHSRHGKAALWAGAIDQRFAMVISNDSGCGGAALSRRKYGETSRTINTTFPHWFCENFKQYNDKENELPVDQHQLIALMAPRLVYIASAVEDRWADPKGEFLSGVHATPVYELFGLTGLPVRDMPAVNQPVHTGYIGYHVRAGYHDINLYDWQQFVKFANKHFK
ncbi:hypothetical protein [Prevotella sp. 10(H)]|uniref:glucuronyl esterase domain-containing protein n=1 Tax=Prevotella sp. 10(H) TaxID=1158294 RepID=UPI0004A7608D|nr:hypothetical protein [Prevotella sp. 10(H)]